MMGLHGTFACADHGVLSLEEGAVGLSREGRFGNQTILYYTVADHLLACMHFARAWDTLPRTVLLVGLHDFHESMTRDVPTDLKTKDTRVLQQAIDERLYAMLGISEPNDVERHVIKTIDTEMLLAEASLVCPVATYEKIISELGGRTATHVARRSVGWVLQQQLSAPDTAAEWLRQIEELLP